MIRLLKIPKIITAAVLLPIFLFGIVGAASYSGLIFERSSYRGYFSDNYDDEGEVVIHGIPSSVNSKQAFIEFLKQYNVSSDKQNKTGTAFIVCTMLNLTAINCAKSYLDSDRNITQAGWAELESRINNADVTMDTGNINIPFGTSFINSYYQGASTGSNPIDDAFYKDNNNGKGNASSGRNEPGFIFWYKGEIVYRLFRRCANPLGNLPGLPADDSNIEPNPTNSDTSSLTPSIKTSFNNNDVVDGASTIGYVTGSVYNNGPGDTTYVKTNDRYGLWPGEKYTSLSYPNYFTNWQISEVIIKPGVARNTKSTAINSSSDPCGHYKNSNLNISCKSLKSGNGTTLSARSTYSSEEDNISIDDLEVGTQVCYGMSVYNSGSVADQSDVQYSQTYNPTYAPTYPIIGADGKPTGATGGGGQDGVSLNTYSTINTTKPNGLWAHSGLNCVTIGKSPKVQVSGGDLWSASSVDTSISAKNVIGSTSLFGSWAEYGIFASGNISGMASGSAFSNGLTNATSSICRYSTLSFALDTRSSSCGSDTTVGAYVSKSMPDVAASFSVSSKTTKLSGIVNLNNLSISGVYAADGKITITGGSIASRNWYVINAPNFDIEISGNIIYTSNVLGDIYDIPQVIIIAKSITIDGSVSNVDAWLISQNKDKTGAIYTCESQGKKIDECNQKLTVNGPVITDKLYLYRTAGSGISGSSGDPAEVFNLRADAYLWAYSRAISSSIVQTVYTTELPPRL